MSDAARGVYLMLFSDSTGSSLAGTGPELEPSPDAAKNPLVGRLLCGKWRVERLLGTGGMSSVYAATHRYGKRVAVKVLSPELRVNRRARERFLREGYIANRVGHDGAVSVLDDDTTPDGVVFLVMELLEGETVAERCERQGGRLQPAEALALADSLLDVLIAAHRNGIIHRDVKPSNLFLTRQVGLKLLDFGIASLRELPRALSHTGSGAQLGTPGFMAPEQARGRWSEVGAQTDIWATGATLFRLLSGRKVHAAHTVNEALIAAATEPAPSLLSVDPGTPPALAALVDKALAFEPKARFQSAAEMREALRAACADLSVQLEQTGSALELPARVTSATGRRRRLLSAVPARAWLLGGVCALGLATSGMLLRAPRVASEAATDARHAGEPKTTRQESALPSRPETVEPSAQALQVAAVAASSSASPTRPSTLRPSSAPRAPQGRPLPKLAAAVELRAAEVTVAPEPEPAHQSPAAPTSRLAESPSDPRDRR